MYLPIHWKMVVGTESEEATMTPLRITSSFSSIMGQPAPTTSMFKLPSPAEIVQL